MFADPSRGPTRALRAAAFTGATVSVSLGAHLTAGGRANLSPVVVLAALAVLALAARLARQRWSARGIFPGLLLSQVLLHAAFTGSHAPTLGHHSPAPASDQLDGGGHGLSGQMLLAHLAATIVLTWVLDQGERGLWSQLARLLRLRIGPLHGAHPRTSAYVLAVAPALDLHPGTRPGRGPPVLC